MIYSSPINEKSSGLWHMPEGNLWSKFDVISLKVNHRQGNDKIYADMLNRIRIGSQTEEDLKLLNTRVFPRNSDCLPHNAVLVTGENLIVKKVNTRKLDELEGKEFTMVADVRSKSRGIFKPFIDRAGQVKNTPLQYELKVKKRARIMLTSNLDVCDNLSNGTLGEVIDFVFNTKGDIIYVMVKFDDKTAGENLRRKNNFDKKFPGQNLVGIKKIEFDFQIKKGSTSTATVINFPLKLAWATTCHKIQVFTDCYIVICQNKAYRSYYQLIIKE